ncbi:MULTISPECIES: radical SAM protein [Planktothrix]|uniref:Fe-S oxidoreductase n=1 Tax=Planktothrix rubescens CCAP 1459/22 TaxID=329571 RepID=A0A6J7ZG96_PLARU|nr:MULTISPECIES: radical SAM protein [Planktothrix]CAC5342920.1 Fe-S oxidoreductase [Planktothrix rubescens NIVA-CYA 18]CAD5974683.1 Radical SAM domain protein [Planktothrix rubescens NIVA-CYA 18]
MVANKYPTIGLIEPPATGLYDAEGKNWTSLYRHRSLISKQVLIPDLQAGGFDARLVNLRDDNYSEEFGEIVWKGITLRKTYVGGKIATLDPQAFDAWGITVNFSQDRQVTCMVIEHLAKGGRPIVVGGSDAFAEPHHYLKAGAAAVVQDKSGAANWAIFDYVLGKTPREELTGVILANGKQYARKNKAKSPEEWALPSVDVARECLGTLPNVQGTVPVGSLVADIGCDRTCDFCMTPTYGTGFRRMTPETALKWLAIQKEAGARSINIGSDQFLARGLFPDGRQEILDITNGAREMGITLMWPNGLELRKTTLGAGRNYESSDLRPDEEMIEALFGWDGKVGCPLAYIPAERPVFGREAYKKLLPWQEHCTLMKSVVRTGVPVIAYGIIIGLPDDDHEDLLRLEEAITELVDELVEINPQLEFQTSCYSIIPLPGTPQSYNLRKSGLLQFEDTCLWGVWTTTSNTNHLSYEQVSDWQIRLSKIRRSPSEFTNYNGEYSGMVSDASSDDSKVVLANLN